jgi:succinate-semialdehyde dehydrogenase/glutarate-semialdehyde dehydrogenase
MKMDREEKVIQVAPFLFRQQAYIDGQWREAYKDEQIEVINPATGELLGFVPNMGAEETTEAIEAAHRAFQLWRVYSAKQRSGLLRKWFDLIVAHAQDLAILMTLEQGKPLTEALGEVQYAAAFIEWFAEEGKRLYGDVIPSPTPDKRLIVIKQPIGVCAAITPWNFPLAMITRKAAPALAAGCTMVVKPASETPFCALALAALAERAGLPKGVFNVVTGDPHAIGLPLTTHPLVHKLSFTGSTAVGRLLMAQCASTIKKVSLELGGNAPFIVFDDADVDAAVEGAMMAKYRNNGQTCIGANRLLIQRGVYAEFVQKLTEKVRHLHVNNGLIEGAQIGPLINQPALDKVNELLQDAVQKGAKVLLGGQQHALGGLFFEPTIVADVKPDMTIFHEEIFGPVAPLTVFDDEKEAIASANATIYGLATYFYSKDVNRVWRVSEQLEYGMVGINTGFISNEAAPFGGVKQSGLGREGSKYGIEEYVEIKYLCMGI